MSKVPVQSRKISFVEVEEEGRTVFHGALIGHEVDFVRKLGDVPEEAEVVSVFISEKIGQDFLAAHPALRFIASRSTGCDHIDLEACQKRGVLVANAAKYAAQFLLQPPRPPHWGGYRLKPDNWQFWQGRKSRLHDRLRYTLEPDGRWLRERLAP